MAEISAIKTPVILKPSPPRTQPQKRVPDGQIAALNARETIDRRRLATQAEPIRKTAEQVKLQSEARGDKQEVADRAKEQADRAQQQIIADIAQQSAARGDQIAFDKQEQIRHELAQIAQGKSVKEVIDHRVPAPVVNVTPPTTEAQVAMQSAARGDQVAGEAQPTDKQTTIKEQLIPPPEAATAQPPPAEVPVATPPTPPPEAAITESELRPNPEIIKELNAVLTEIHDLYLQHLNPKNILRLFHIGLMRHVQGPAGAEYAIGVLDQIMAHANESNLASAVDRSKPTLTQAQIDQIETVQKELAKNIRAGTHPLVDEAQAAGILDAKQAEKLKQNPDLDPEDIAAEIWKSEQRKIGNGEMTSIQKLITKLTNGTVDLNKEGFMGICEVPEEQAEEFNKTAAKFRHMSVKNAVLHAGSKGIMALLGVIAAFSMFSQIIEGGETQH